MVLGGRVYVGALDGKLYCLDADNGNIIWEFRGVEPCKILCTPAIHDGAIYLPSTRGGWNIRRGQGPPIETGDFYKLDLNGNVIWHKEIPWRLDWSTNLGNWLWASPTVAPELNLVFLRNAYRITYGMDMDTGDIVWERDGRYNPGTPFQHGGAPQIDAGIYAYGRLYMNDYYGVVCVNATDGEEIWFTYLSREINNPGMSYSYGRVYAATENGVLYVLDAITGAKRSYYEFGYKGSTVQLHSSPVPYNGMLLVGCMDWNMYCFGEARLMGSAAPHASVSASTSMPIESTTEISEAPLITTELAIIAAVAAAVVIGIASYWTLRKRK
jgi:outer membrane protein assembly factor BamB